MSTMHITITDDEIYVSKQEGDISSSKFITYTDFMNMLRRGVPEEEFRTGLLPPNCLGIKKYKNGDVFIALPHPELKADVVLYNTSYTGFPLPQLVFGYMLSRDGHVKERYVGVTENTDYLKPDSPMYHYPFTNVNENGSICIGVNSLPEIKHLSTITRLNYLILAMPNNHDHYGFNHNKANMEMRQLFEHLKDKDTDYYYTDVLIPNNQTLENFINHEWR